MTSSEFVYDIIKSAKNFKHGEADKEFADFTEIIKREYPNKIAKFIRQEIFKHGLRSEYTSSFAVRLEQVDKSEALCQTIPCTILRTVNTIPTPIQIQGSLFTFVGSIDRSVPFIYTRLDELPFTFHNDFTSLNPRWDYRNKRIYVYNVKRIKRIVVEGIYTKIINGDVCPAVGDCYTDNNELPFPEHILDYVKREFIEEL
jgi:hypothetical protein